MRATDAVDVELLHAVTTLQRLEALQRHLAGTRDELQEQCALFL